MPFVYENNGLKVVPTFASVINRGEAPPERQRMPQKSSINFMMVVDGERRITFHKPLPPSADAGRRRAHLDILDKGEGKGAVLVQERVVREAASGEKLFTIVVVHLRARRWRLRRPKPQGGPELHAIPDRAPDLVKECDTRPDQAFLYALSGDRNPLHRDPAFAKMVGFPRPILHGLCSYGTACRAILSTVARIPARTHQAIRCAFFQAGLSRRNPGDGNLGGWRHDLLSRLGEGAPGHGGAEQRALPSWLDGDPIEAAEALIAAGRADEAARRFARAAGGGARRRAGAGDPGQGAAGGGRREGALAEAREAVSLNPNVAPSLCWRWAKPCWRRSLCPPPSPNCSGRCGSIPHLDARARF